MKKRLQGLVAGVLISAVLASGAVFAKNIQETINAVYMNVKLVIDGIEVQPKDASGNYVEPFIYNGTTYLPVRAVGEAFGKEVTWDGDTATVYVGGEVEKAAKEVYLYDKPYMECEDAGCFSAGKNSGKLNNYISMEFGINDDDDYVTLDNGRYSDDKYVVYPLNGLAKKVRGTFVAPNNSGKPEVQIKFYNESGKLLYQSPIMNNATAPVDFEFDVTNCINLKVECTGISARTYNDVDCNISDFAVVTTDY